MHVTKFDVTSDLRKLCCRLHGNQIPKLYSQNVRFGQIWKYQNTDHTKTKAEAGMFYRELNFRSNLTFSTRSVKFLRMKKKKRFATDSL